MSLKQVDILDKNLTKFLFRPIPNIPERYLVSCSGSVFDKGKDDFIKQRLRKDGYLDVAIKTFYGWKYFLVHRMVLCAFKGLPTVNEPLARHLDGSRDNNTIDNLVWGTYEENRADRILHGTSSTGNNYGEKSGSNTLMDKDVYEIKHLLLYTKIFHKDIAKMYGVNREAISKIHQDIRWKHINIKY
jgi:hypothetical protein